MSKILTDKELAQIITKACNDEYVIDCMDSYIHFLEDLGSLIADHFGGVRGSVDFETADEKYYVAFEVDESAPLYGGVFREYDTDVTWRNGVET